MAVSTTPGTEWGSWKKLDGSVYSEPAPVLEADNRVRVFVQGAGNSLWSRGQSRARAWGD